MKTHQKAFENIPLKLSRIVETAVGSNLWSILKYLYFTGKNWTIPQFYSTGFCQKINVIPDGLEKYVAFILGKELAFIDSM